MKRLALPALGFALVLIATAFIWTKVDSASGTPVQPATILRPYFQQPVDNWIVCQNLGVGVVPGLPDERQRFRLCHDQAGWEVVAYCLQPDLPAPVVGTICSLIDEDTFFCGSGIQNLRVYGVVQTPSPTPTATTTPTTTPTPTPSETPRTTPRPRPGGAGNFSWGALAYFQSVFVATRTPFQPQPPTKTPFQPVPPTATPSPQATPVPEGASENELSIDFTDHQKRIQISIIPQDKRVNRGKPIVVSFIPGQKCVYGDHRACIHTYQTETQSQITHITVHSGMGGEGQAFRHALEGTGINSAGYPLKRVLANLRALDGADVVITQGKKRMAGFVLVAASRVPASAMNAYFDLPVEQALTFASNREPSLSKWVNPSQPQIVLETCGWKMPGEPWAKGVSSTTASVYLGIIQLKAQ